MERVEYINKEKLVFDLLSMSKYQSEDRKRAFFDIVDFVKFVRASDAEEARRGKWIYHECVSSYDGMKSGYSCSECNSFVDENVFDMDEFQKDYCGHCGAIMNKKKG